MMISRNEFQKFALWKLAKIFHGLCVRDTFKQLDSAEILFIAPDAARNELTLDRLLYCRLLDPLSSHLNKLGMTVSHLSRSPSVLSTARTYSGALTYNRSHAIAILMSLFVPKPVGFRLRTKWAQRLIKMSGVKIIFTWEGQAEIRAGAKLAGVPCVEVIHGIGYPPDTPTAWLFGSEDVWPSHVICFDTVTAETIRKHSQNRETQVLQAKNFWLSNFLESPDPSDNRQEGLEELFPPVHIPSQIKTKVLVTLSWGHDAFASDSPFGKIWEIISEPSDSTFWWIRFHPVQLSSNRGIDRDVIRQAKLRFSDSTNVDIKQCQNLPLPLLAKQATHHITLASMSSYELAEFGVPTLFLSGKDSPINKVNRSGYFEDLFEEGFATIDHSPETEIRLWLKNQGPVPRRGNSQQGDSIASIMRALMIRGDTLE